MVMTDSELQGLAYTPLPTAAGIVCESVGIDREDLMARTSWGSLRRSGGLPELRGKVWSMLRAVRRFGTHRWSLSELAEEFGVNHSTIATAVARHRETENVNKKIPPGASERLHAEPDAGSRR